MFLAYLDSSGRSDYSDLEDFVVASVTVNEHQWYLFKDEIDEIKKKHFPLLDPEKVEFHAKDMMNREGIYKGLSWEKIFEILDDFFNFISKERVRLTIIASLIQKGKLHKRIDLELWGHRMLFERLNTFINQENNFLVQAGNPHEYCIMIVDSEGQVKDQKLRNKLIGMLTSGTFYSDLDFLIEDPLFTDSKWRNLSQVVDCIAYCIRKKYRENNKDTTHTRKWLEYFSKIEPKFHHKNGNYLRYGLKIFP